jgi:hypothetical protein
MKVAWALAALVACWPATRVEAHAIGQSYFYLQVYEDRVTGRFEISLEDLNAVFWLAGIDHRVTPETLDEAIPLLHDYYRERVALFDASGAPLTVTFTSHGLLDERGGYALLSFDLGGPAGVPERMIVDYDVLFDEDSEHRALLIVEHHWGTGTFANEARASLEFSPDVRRQEFTLPTGSRTTGVLTLVGRGAREITAGIDHLLFVVALLLPVAFVRHRGEPPSAPQAVHFDATRASVAFAIGYAMALVLGSVELVFLPPRLVETVIGASVGVVAVHAVRPLLGRSLAIAAAGFGLFHGLGFSVTLYRLGALQEHLWLGLSAFLSGLLLAQLATVLLVAGGLRVAWHPVQLRRVVLHAVAAVMIVLSVLWIAQRGLDLGFLKPGSLVAAARDALS